MTGSDYGECVGRAASASKNSPVLRSRAITGFGIQLRISPHQYIQTRRTGDALTSGFLEPSDLFDREPPQAFDGVGGRFAGTASTSQWGSS